MAQALVELKEGQSFPTDTPDLVITVLNTFRALQNGETILGLKKLEGLEDIFELSLGNSARLFIKKGKPTTYYLAYFREHLETPKEYKGIFG